MAAGDLFVLRAWGDRTEYFQSPGVWVTDSREAAHFTSRKTAKEVANTLCEADRPCVPVITERSWTDE